MIPLPHWNPRNHVRDLYGLIPSRTPDLRLGPLVRRGKYPISTRTIYRLRSQRQ